MGNPLLDIVGKPQPQQGGNIIQQFMQFKQQIGSPDQAKQQVMQMLSSGQVSKDKLEEAKQFAQKFQGLMK